MVLQLQVEMRGRFKLKNQDETAGGAADREAEPAARPGAPAADSEEPSGPGSPGGKKGRRAYPDSFIMTKLYQILT